MRSYIKDGKTSCKQIVAETMCPLLDCPSEQQLTREGECCKFCAGINRNDYLFISLFDYML